MTALEAIHVTTGLVRYIYRDISLFTAWLVVPLREKHRHNDHKLHDFRVHTQPWWATLMTGGAAVRLGLYPLTRRAQESTSMVVSAFRQAQEQALQDIVENQEGAPVDRSPSRTEVVRRAREIIRAHPQRTSPVWMVAAPVAQVTVLVYGLYSVRYMAKEGWSGLAAGGPAWAVDLTLPAVDVATATAPLGMQGIIMPAALLGGFMTSISRIRPGRTENGGKALTEREQVQRWLMGHMSTLLEVLTIPLVFGVLTSPQAPLYYWTASLFTSLGMGAAMDRRQQRALEMARSGVLSNEAQALLQRAAERVSQGDYMNALGFAKQARILAPRNASVHMALGDILASLPGKEMAAVTHYRKAMNLVREHEFHDNDRIIGVDGRMDGELEVLAQRAAFALGMLLSKGYGTKQEALELLEQTASRLNDGDVFQPLAVRALLAIAALSDDTGRRRDALTLATSADAAVASRLRKKMEKQKRKEKRRRDE